MARVLLINPPSPEPVKSPLLSFCYLASSLRRSGHVVAVIDASAPFGPKTDAAILGLLRDFAPNLVGLHLKTLHAQPAYALAKTLAELPDRAFKLVGGGPHATVCAEEPLRFAFDYVIRGEAEESLVELAEAIDGTRRLEDVNALTWPGALAPKHNPSRGFLRDLDALASPIDAIELFDPAWYGAREPVPPVGLLASRGCPAACNFCSNNVTGRQFRYRDAHLLSAEIAALRDRYGMGAFSFFDDSFAVGRRRMEELCDVMQAEAAGVTWTCTAHPAHLDLDIMRRMKLAGCGGIDLGMESGDPAMLLRIGKGVTVERVLDVLRWARELGLHTVLNLMFGWPGETVAELQQTLAFMEKASQWAGGFNARGVLVPYPGTAIYDDHHERFGFTEWWIREPPIEYEPFAAMWTYDEIARAYAEDAALNRNFFRHPPEAIALIRKGLEMKATLTFRVLRAMEARRMAPKVAAAGAR